MLPATLSNQNLHVDRGWPLSRDDAPPRRHDLAQLERVSSRCGLVGPEVQDQFSCARLSEHLRRLSEAERQAEPALANASWQTCGAVHAANCRTSDCDPHRDLQGTLPGWCSLVASVQQSILQQSLS